MGPELPDPARLFEVIKSLPSKDSTIGVKEGVAPTDARTFEAIYTKPYMAHASIGPSCAVAGFKDGRMTVWTHSQGVFPLRGELVKALKMPAAAIRCVHMEGSGCYGHNGADDVAVDAALLARAVPGRPVRLQWMRDDEFRWEPYGPAMVMHAKAALGGDGRIADWEYEVWSNSHSTRPQSTDGTNVLAAWYLAEPQKMGPPTSPPQPAGGGDRNALPLYDFPRQRVIHHFVQDMPIRVSALRTLGAYANVFALESFIDELAAAAGADPVAFRLAHMKDPRARAVIEAVAKKAGWTTGEKGNGTRGRGIGFAKYKNLACYVAVVAEIEVDRANGMVRVPRTWAAVDSGLIINPDGLTSQIEGGIVQSVSWTLKEEVRFDKNGILAHDWVSYPILTMPEAPKVEVELINRPSERPLGAGEGSQGPAVAAVANAFANATGKRIRDLPLDPARVKAALMGGLEPAARGLVQNFNSEDGRIQQEMTNIPNSRCYLVRKDRGAKHAVDITGGDHGHQLHCERQGGVDRRAVGNAAVVGDPGRPQADRHQVRLRHRAVRCLHGAYRRQARVLVPDPGLGDRGQVGDDDRRAVAGYVAPAAAGMARRASPAMRLLSVRPDHERG